MIPSMMHSNISIAVVFWLMYFICGIGVFVSFSLNCKNKHADPLLQ